MYLGKKFYEQKYIIASTYIWTKFDCTYVAGGVFTFAQTFNSHIVWIRLFSYVHKPTISFPTQV